MPRGIWRYIHACLRALGRLPRTCVFAYGDAHGDASAGDAFAALAGLIKVPTATLWVDTFPCSGDEVEYDPTEVLGWSRALQ